MLRVGHRLPGEGQPLGGLLAVADGLVVIGEDELQRRLQAADAIVERHLGHLLDMRLAGFFRVGRRSEEHTSELQSLMRISYAVFCLKQKTKFYTMITIPTPFYNTYIIIIY